MLTLRPENDSMSINLRRAMILLTLIFTADYGINFRLYETLTHWENEVLVDTFLRFIKCLTFFSLIVGFFSLRRLWFFLAYVGTMVHGFFFFPIAFGGDCSLVNLLLAMSLIGVNRQNDFLSHVGRFIIFGQTIVGYFYTGMSKSLDPVWVNGKTALMILKQIGFSPLHVEPFTPFLVYAVILLQFSSFLILLPRCKKYVLIGLAGIHLAMVPVLPLFSLFCVLNLAFISTLERPSLSFLFYGKVGEINPPLTESAAG